MVDRAEQLAPYAASSATSRGRVHAEPSPTYRSEYQRDRDRVVHSGAFRRLEYKTQVFVNHEGDMFRTRLTHSIEVAQIARSIARELCVNEDLTEAICLAHDLGHTPFGHAGQDALGECMAPYGGFEHNIQSLRIVDELEERYAAFPGLNLTFETRAGILKHCDVERARSLGEVARRFVIGGQATIEAQLANVCDEVAYNNHDVDDGLRAGLIGFEQMNAIALFRDPFDEVRALWPDISDRRTTHEVIRRMIDVMVWDLIQETRARLGELCPESADAVMLADSPVVAFSEPMREQVLELKRFLNQNLYKHFRVHRMTAKAGRIIRELFDAFFDDPLILAADVRLRMSELERRDGKAGRARAVADYIAGMTDRYAISEHARVYDPSALT
jgi:dGTPase